MILWTGNDNVFRGYVKGKGKKPVEKIKGEELHSWEEISDYNSFGGILQADMIDISFDSEEQSEKFSKMAEANKWNCLILRNPASGHIHTFWKNNVVEKDGADKKLAVGLTADIHHNMTYIPLRVDGTDRFPPVAEPDVIDELPEELFPIDTQINLLDLGEGDGRNNDLFRYILSLQSQLMLNRDTIKRILENINRFVFKRPLDSRELDTITRDEAFDKPVFYKGKTFCHDLFGKYMKGHYHIKRINGQLHVYDNGIYRPGYRFIENKMIEMIPALKATNRTETLKFLEIITPEESYVADADLIAFRNGIFNVQTEELMPFSPDIIITNRIPWDYNPAAYSKLCDDTLNKIACFDADIRSLLEECIGYCFYRYNELSKSFFLTGSGANGKSTFLDMVRFVLGRENYVSLDMDELSERFSTTTMFGKLANIGDDISDEFLQGKAIATFKKIVSGNDIKAENKGQDAYFFKPTVKLLFSANEIPRMRNKGFEAIKRRLVIIPFNAKFSKDDEDYDQYIIYKLKQQEVAEYMVRIGIAGLKRVLKKHSFTDSKKVQAEVDSFERDNNPILLFLDEVPREQIIGKETKEVFARYDLFCFENGFQKVAIQTFTKEIKRQLDCDRKDARRNGKKIIIFCEKER